MMNSRIDEIGGFSFVSFFVNGKKAFETLKNESGVHRVQRVPETESKGRIQTSTVSVAILPEMDDIEVKIEDKDIRIDTYRSSGAGGQHVNTTDSAVRITHIPTGAFTTSQDGRSQIENKKYALLTLKSIVYERQKKDQEKKIGSIRNSAIGKSERSEKIRTYNFQQSRVTDHRVDFQTNKIEDFMSGNIEEVCRKLLEQDDNIERNVFFKLNKISSFFKEAKKDDNF
jgi:peptide chain release factor 1